MMDRASRLAARDARTAANRARLQASRDAMNQRRAAKGKKAIDYAAADARYGRYGAKKMASGGDVKKMQVGGMAERRAASEARIARDRAALDARRSARTPAKPGSRLEAVRKANDEKFAASRAARDAARQARYARQDARAAARNRARGIGGSAAPEMKSGGDVKKYAEGGSIYRKAADGVATRGKTRGTEIKMRKGGMC